MNGRNSISCKEKFELDIKYLQKISLFFDVKIIILTILKIISFSNKDIDNSSSVTMEKFKGNL